MVVWQLTFQSVLVNANEENITEKRVLKKPTKQIRLKCFVGNLN